MDGKLVRILSDGCSLEMFWNKVLKRIFGSDWKGVVR
jgi:hypothetical protein